MSDDQNIATNAQPTSDAQAAGDDVEGHFVRYRGDDAAKGGLGQPEGFVIARNDTPDGSPTEG